MNSPFGHKSYQNDTLDALRLYLRRATEENDADTAFYKQTKRGYLDVGEKLNISTLRGMPYVCLRIPTGGGKTVVACRAIRVVVDELLRRENPLVLWLAPSEAIVSQTLNALKNRAHPYRIALESELGPNIEAISLDEATMITRATLDSNTTILVCTVQSLRIQEDKTDKRGIYKQNGALMSHFDSLTLAQNELPLERYENGKPIESLANALALRTPIVMADEAQNFRTRLTFESLARFCPSIVLEWTATPEREEFPPNVLYHVSAAELKAEGMIKMPVELRTESDWKTCLRDAKIKRDELETLAQSLIDETLRPIALLQAQKANEHVSWERLETTLRDELGVPQNQIAVETGTRSDLKDVDVLAPACPIRYVITVDKLREGWDCPPAYVLYSARNLSSATAIEQLLGRVLRMPGARRKPDSHEPLNHAYAFVTSTQFGDALKALKDALVKSGFEKFEADKAVVGIQLPLLPAPQIGLFAEPASVSTKPKAPLLVPQLALQMEGGAWETLDADEILDVDWRLLDYAATLNEKEFASEVARERVELDIAGEGKLKVAVARDYLTLTQNAQLSLVDEDIQTAPQLALWLDKHIPHRDLDGAQVQEWLLKLLEWLQSERNLSIEKLARERVRLKNAVAEKIKFNRKEAERSALRKLFVDETRIAVREECEFAFQPDVYPVGARYEGTRVFHKHFYETVGALNGEEEQCAWFLNISPKVKTWVRNLEKKPEAAFWLQTEDGRFYPDFVAQLEDGRVAIIEYKGGDRISNDDTKRKTRVGQLWQARSGGKGVFLMVGVDDYQPRISAL